MKQLFLVAFLVLATIVVYDFFIADPGERRVFPETLPSFIKVTDKKSKSDDVPPPTPKVVNAPVAKKAADKSKFVPPTFETIESVTRDWTFIPPQAFPRPVRLRTPVRITMAAGSATLSEGAEVTAHGIDNGMLAVSPTPSSSARGSLSVHDTDLVDDLTQRYNDWVAARIDRARKAWEYRQQQGRSQTAANTQPTSTAKMLDSKGKPVRNAKGGYDIVLSRIRSGAVIDIDPAKITAWGTARSVELEGETYWGVDIFFVTETIFGPFDAQARAYIRDGEVIHWRYPASNEPVL